MAYKYFQGGNTASRRKLFPDAELMHVRESGIRISELAWLNCDKSKLVFTVLLEGKDLINWWLIFLKKCQCSGAYRRVQWENLRRFHCFGSAFAGFGWFTRRQSD